MLGGLAPIILFNFSQRTPSLNDQPGSIPIISDIVDSFPLPPIPVYLDENLTGLMIDSETKNVDIETKVDTLKNGDDPVVNQKGINSTVSIQMQARRGNIGVALLSALIDRIFEKVTSKEYSISYLNGPVTVFGGLLHSFSIDQNADNDLLNIKMEIVRTTDSTVPVASIPQVGKVTGTVPL
jgi:hypothetical protein